MSSGEKHASDHPSESGPERPPERSDGGAAAGAESGGRAADGATEDVGRLRGFRSQPLALKILLGVSLSALVVGVVRCSIELTSVERVISRIGVERALVDLDQAAAWAPADSVAARAARQFADALREASNADVRLASPGAGGFDAIARLRISDANGGIRLAVGIVDGASGRALFETSGEGAPEMLPGLANRAALRVTAALGIASNSVPNAERPGREPEGS
jgi:hypothetical protein